MPQVENGEQQKFAGKRVLKGAATPSSILHLLDRIRHPNGAVNHKHPDIKDMMRQARKDKSDVLLIPRGDGIDVVVGRFLADHDRLVKVCAGVALGVGVAGAVGFVLRKHRR